ncbi:MAG: pyridoxal phosphate-dependent aminotransferase [Candidatus Micrarchaeota archaeon]
MKGFYGLAERALALEKAGKKIVRLNVGDTNLPTPQCAIEAALASLEEERAGYCPAAGLPGLREAIAKREGCEPSEVVVGPGSKLLIYGLMSMLCKQGDAISFPSPYWPMYELAARQLGLEAKAPESSMEDGWAFDPADIDGNKLTIICNPLNPTSTIYDEKLVQEAIGRCQEENSFLLLDEAYKALAFDKLPRYEGAIRVRSFSKEFNMEGWRLGYAVVPEHIAEKLTAFLQITATCTAPFVQKAGIACLENEKGIIAGNLKVWRSRSAVAAKALSENGFRFAKPEAGIYIFATHDGIKDSEKYATELMEKEGIVVSPGSSFGGYTDFIRICVNQPEDALMDAITRMSP